jgi:raffinose/stachyose/melibiose transport system permease protein
MRKSAQSSAKTNKYWGAKRKIRDHSTYFLFMLPALVFFLLVVVLPFIQGIPYSFTNWKSIVSTNKEFIGLHNYRMLITNKYFLQALGNTFKYTITYIIASNIIGLTIALLLQKSNWFNNFARTLVFMPFVVALTSAALVWRYVYTDIYGALFNTFSPLGISRQVIVGMAVIGIWRDMGYCMLIFIAALQAIPSDYYEAATVSGANKFQQFRYITLPLIVPAFTSNITLLLAWGLRLFDLPMAVARNVEAAQTTSMFIYDYIFSFSKAGLGQAAAIIVTCILVILTKIINDMFRKLEVEA